MIPEKVMGSLIERMIINCFSQHLKRSYIEGEIETEDVEQEENSNISCIQGFTKILLQHMREVNFVTIILVTGANCCELEGVICSVYSDYIIVIDEGVKTAVPIDKIAAVKKVTSCQKHKPKNKSGGYPVICESEEKYYPGMVKEDPLL